MNTVVRSERRSVCVWGDGNYDVQRFRPSWIRPETPWSAIIPHARRALQPWIIRIYMLTSYRARDTRRSFCCRQCWRRRNTNCSRSCRYCQTRGRLCRAIVIFRDMAFFWWALSLVERYGEIREQGANREREESAPTEIHERRERRDATERHALSSVDA